MSSISHRITTKSALTNSKKRIIHICVAVFLFTILAQKNFPIGIDKQAGRQAQRSTRRARRTWDWNWKLDNMSKAVCARIEFAMQSNPQSSMILCAALCVSFLFCCFSSSLASRACRDHSPFQCLFASAANSSNRNIIWMLQSIEIAFE